MLSSIFEILKSIGNFFVTIFDFVFGLVKDLAYVVQLLSVTVTQLPSYLAWLPSTFVATIVGVFSIVIIYKVVGREG